VTDGGSVVTKPTNEAVIAKVEEMLKLAKADA
jgi:hypothetical protein